MNSSAFTTSAVHLDIEHRVAGAAYEFGSIASYEQEALDYRLARVCRPNAARLTSKKEV